MKLQAYKNYEDHINLVAGRMPSPEIVNGSIIECLVNRNTIVTRDFIVDELLQINYSYETDENLFIKIVGIFEADDNQEFYWVNNPNEFEDVMLVSFDLFENELDVFYERKFRIYAHWHILLDYLQMRVENIPQYILSEQNVGEFFSQPEYVIYYENNFTDKLKITGEVKLDSTLLVLLLPVYVLLAFYIFMVTKQILNLEQNAIAVIKSRGAGRRQIVAVYFLQSILIMTVSFVLGIALGFIICKIIGSANGFMDMVQRTALEVKVNRNAVFHSLCAGVISLLTMLVPVIGYSRYAIVDYKRDRHGKIKKPVWQRFFLDFLMLGVSCYGLYSFNSRRELMASALTNIQTADPLLYISATLFIAGLGLLFVRMFPWIVRLIFFIGKNNWKPVSYAPLLKVVRTTGEEQFVMIFLVFTLSAGIFATHYARTLNSNNEDRIRYITGADIVFAEKWEDNWPTAYEIANQSWPPIEFPSEKIYIEPDIGRYTALDEIDYLTTVMNLPVQLRGIFLNRLEYVNLLGIDTVSFIETAWFRNDLLPVHINYFLNTLSSYDNGVLLSSNFKDIADIAVGDEINVLNNEKKSVKFFVCGFVDYWPGYAPVIKAGQEGNYNLKDQYLLVANINYVRSTWGRLPYEIWLKTNTTSNQFLHDFAYEYSVKQDDYIQSYIKYEDANGSIINKKNDPIVQGTNGALTVSFIVTLMICFTGFLIYWILSINARVLQFGVFRAMGMSMRNVLRLLVNEQLIVSLTGIVAGVLIGEAASVLFVPLLQISYAASEQIIPLVVFSDAGDYINLFAVIGVSLIFCLIIIGLIVSKIKIVQALKLGED